MPLLVADLPRVPNALPAERTHEVEPSHEPGLPPPENRTFYPALDGLRALAVLLVFFHHYRQPTWRWLEWGWVGVDVFFVLSGFLITGILYDTRNAPHSFRTFYARRTLRIFPLFYGVWLAALLATPVFHFHWSPHWLLWPFYLGNYTHLTALGAVPQDAVDWLARDATQLGYSHFISFGHLWSLCVEEQFYLVWPLVVYLVRDRRRLLSVCLVVIVLSPLLRAAAILTLPRPWIAAELLYRGTPFRADALLMGAALALVLRGPRAAAWQRPRLPLLGFLLSVGLCLAIGLLAIHLHGASTSGLPVVPWIMTAGFTLVDLAAASLLLACLRPASPLARVLSFGPLRALGRISYGFYVFHDILHPEYGMLGSHLARHIHHNTAHPYPAYVFALPCTLLLAACSYQFFEKPFLRLKRHFP